MNTHSKIKQPIGYQKDPGRLEDIMRKLNNAEFMQEVKQSLRINEIDLHEFNRVILDLYTRVEDILAQDRLDLAKKSISDKLWIKH